MNRRRLRLRVRITRCLTVAVLIVHSCRGTDWYAQRTLRGYSHSMVAGGLEEMSYTTRLTPWTSLMMRLEMRARTS